jgi:hypothetical protein
VTNRTSDAIVRQIQTFRISLLRRDTYRSEGLVRPSALLVDSPPGNRADVALRDAARSRKKRFALQGVWTPFGLHGPIAGADRIEEIPRKRGGTTRVCVVGPRELESLTSTVSR